MPAFQEAVTALLNGANADEIESTTLECKQEDESVKQTFALLADVVVCLANTEGGTLIVGVHDKLRGPDAILGVSEALTTDRTVKGIFDRTRPPLSVPVTEHEVNGRRLLEITVPRGATFYANAKGTSTRRVGSACLPFPPEEQRQSLAARGLYDWSAEPAGTSVYSAEEVGRVRRLLRTSGRTELADQDDVAILRDLRLTTPSGELNRAGLLLVGDPDQIETLIPTYGYSYQHRTSPGAEATYRTRERRGVLAAVEQLIDLVDARKSVRPLNIAGGVQLTLQDYPTDAVRELVVNALVHRDYEREGSVDIEQTPSHLRITSPGSLVHGVTPENILSHPSTPRNTRLLDAVTTLSVAERSGQGIDRAYRVLLRNGKQPPTFTDTGTLVEVDVPGGAGNDSFVRYVTSGLAENLSSDIEVLLVLDMLRNQKSVNAQQVAPVIQRATARAQTALAHLAAEGILEPSRRTATNPYPNYGLTAATLTGLGLAVTYHRRSNDDVDAKVVAHVTEYGYITNQTLRRLFDVDVYAARDLLADLQRREILAKEPGMTRGPGVRYAKGARFPA